VRARPQQQQDSKEAKMSSIMFRRGKRILFSLPLEEIERKVGDIRNWYVTADNVLALDPGDADVTVGDAVSVGASIIVDVEGDIDEDSAVRYMATRVAPLARGVAECLRGHAETYGQRATPYAIRQMANGARFWAQFLKYQRFLDDRSREFLREAEAALLDALDRVQKAQHAHTIDGVCEVVEG
jgi:hypothetical protein